MLHPNSVLRAQSGRRGLRRLRRDRQSDRPMRGGPPHEPARQQESGHRSPLTLSAAFYFARRFEECIHAGRRALAFAPQTIPPASTSPYPSPSLAASTRRGPRSPSSSSTSPTLRSHSSASRFPPQVDAGAAYGRPAQGGVAGRVATQRQKMTTYRSLYRSTECHFGCSRYVACWHFSDVAKPAGMSASEWEADIVIPSVRGWPLLAQSGHLLERRDQGKPNYIAISITYEFAVLF